MKPLGVQQMPTQKQIDAAMKEARRLQAVEVRRICILLAHFTMIFLRQRMNTLKTYACRRKLTSTLYQMSDRQLKDIGLNRCEIMAVVETGYRPNRSHQPISNMVRGSYKIPKNLSRAA